METAISGMIAVSGLAFSIAITLMLEELLMGRMLHLLFSRTNTQIAEQRRKENKTCC